MKKSNTLSNNAYRTILEVAVFAVAVYFIFTA